MSMALVRKMLQQQLQQQQEERTQGKLNRHGLKTTSIHNMKKLQEEDEDKEKNVKKRIDQILLVDHALYRGSSSIHDKARLQRKQTLTETEPKVSHISNTRSCSSVFKALKKEPTWNKKREIKRKRAQDMKELAYRMKQEFSG